MKLTKALDMPRILGIDPGLKGALVLIDTDAGTLACEPMPIVRQRRSNGKFKTFICEESLALLVRRWGPACGWIEDVFARSSSGGPDGEGGHRESARAAFSFGEGKGILKGVLAGCGVPRRYVSPMKWKRDLNVGTEGVLITARCNRLFPECAKLLKSEGKREAAMITLWGCLDDGLKVGPLIPVTDGMIVGRNGG